MMAQKTTTSQRSTRRRGQNASARSGKASSTSRKRSNQGADGSRPAEEALHGRTEVDRQFRYYERREEEDRTGPPDVLLDVPELRVDLIHIELDDLDAHVALKARVLNLVKLNIGLDVHLSRTKLDIKGVQAELLMKARLDHVTAIVDRLMTSLDRNPELVKGLSRAVSDIGAGAGEAVDKTGDAAKDVGKGAQSALTDVGHGAGEAVGDVGQGAGQAVGNLDQLVGGVGQTVGQAGQTLGGVGQGAGQLAQGAGQTVGGLAQGGQSAGQPQNGGQQQGQHDGQPNGGADTATPGRLAKEAARMLARELGHAATDEARDLGHAATRKVRELGERREQRRVEKYNATETAMRVADELGIDLARLEGSGYGGRITVKDVRGATQA
jgi:e3 binding domain